MSTFTQHSPQDAPRAPEVFQRWVIHDKDFTAAELADAMDVPIGTFYKYMEGEREIPFDRARRASLYACRTRGRYGLVLCLLTSDFDVLPRGEARANGRIDDDVTEAVIALGQAAKAHGDEDLDALDAAIAAHDRKGLDLKAERDRLARKLSAG